MRNLISTIIPVYNRAFYLVDAVKSVLNQTYRPIEIILIDDGSTDDTSDTIAELVASHPDVIRSCRIENSGPGGAREQGRRTALGEFIQYLDSDDILWPDKFAAQVAALKSNPDCGVAYGKTRLVDSNGGELIAPFKLSGVCMSHLFPALLVDRWWNTHTPLYRKSVCDSVGPWPAMRMGEDWLYDARVGALGTKLCFCNQFVSDHRQHEQTRLTGGGISPSSMKDFGELLPQLYNCAIEAGVPHNSPEMKHFSRWAFATARQLGQVGESSLAQRCFKTARQAGSDSLKEIEFCAFSSLVKIFGWQVTSSLSESLRALAGRQPGSASLQQSWMKQ